MNFEDLLYINNIPSSKKQEIGFRTKSNSHEINEMHNNFLQDILDLFNKTNKIEKNITELKDYYNIDNQYLNLKINELASIIAKLTEEYKNKINGSNDKIKTLYSFNTINNEYNTANIDHSTNCITLQNIYYESKVNVYDETLDVTIVPETLKVETEPDLTKNTNILEITDTNIYNMFDNDNNTFYIKKIKTKNNVNNITLSFIITLPDNISTSRKINGIKLQPFPSNSMDIISIEYRNNNGAWNKLDLSNYKNNVLEQYKDIFNNIESENNVINNATNIRLDFNDVIATQIKITVRQNRYVLDKDNNRLFYIGFKTLDIYQNNYKNYDTFVMLADFKNDKIAGKNIVIKGIEADYNNENEIETNKVLKWELYYIDELGIEHLITDSLPFILPKDKLLLKCKLYSINNTTPNLSTIKIKYNYV